MKSFHGKTLSWNVEAGVIEMKLHREPCNEIGSAMLADLEAFAEAFESAGESCGALIIYSGLAAGFSAGADLRELHRRSQGMSAAERAAGVRGFLLRIHRVLNTIDAAPMVTIAAVHGVTFGGGLELALACDLIIADKTARFCFPELRLGLIPGFGGIPRLKRDIGNAVIRDMLLTGRSFNATKAQAAGLVSQVTAEGEALSVGARDGGANTQIRSRDNDRGEAFHQADSIRGIAAGDRNLLRDVQPACRGRRIAEVCG